MRDEYIFTPEVDEKNHIIATYFLGGKDLIKCAEGVAIGQSIGNPNVEVRREDERMLMENLAKIMAKKQDLQNKNSGIVKIAYPLVNIDVQEDGISQLLCILQGGQLDIDYIESCRLLDVEFPNSYLQQFKGPKIGMVEIKRRTQAQNRPLLGGIVKPKTGITIPELEELVQELLDGGVDFIKEDEILGNPAFCKFKERVPRIAEMVRKHNEKEGREVFYAACINSDFPHFIDRAKFASQQGLNAVHLNFWAGLGAYKTLRDLDMDNTAIFFQKSGDRILTGKNNPYGIEWKVVCDIARMSGCDFIHAGMWGGYSSYPKEELDKVMSVLRDEDRFKQTVPSLSCGSNPGLVDTTVKNYGLDVLMNAGGAIQGHPMGTRAGAIAMRQAFDCNATRADIYDFMQDKPELKVAIEKWGYVHPETNKILYKK